MTLTRLSNTGRTLPHQQTALVPTLFERPPLKLEDSIAKPCLLRHNQGGGVTGDMFIPNSEIFDGVFGVKTFCVRDLFRWLQHGAFMIVVVLGT